jgi:hypothetical protein
VQDVGWSGGSLTLSESDFARRQHDCKRTTEEAEIKEDQGTWASAQTENPGKQRARIITITLATTEIGNARNDFLSDQFVSNLTTIPISSLVLFLFILS